MRRVQPTIVQSNQQHTVRRVIHPQTNVQMNAVKKINNLMQSGSVSVSTQPRQVVRQTSIYQSQLQTGHKCFICDENIIGAATSLTETETLTSHEKVTKKLAKMVGDDFCVIVSEDDVICRRCLTLFNTMDKYEFDLENVRTRLRGFINKKYSIDEQEEPPTKMQKLNTGSPNHRWQNNSSDESTPTITRKIMVSGRDSAESQLKSVYSPSGNTSVTSSSPAAQPPKRGPIKLYKCIACDFKTTDLSAFQPHSNVCKGQANKNPSPAPGNRVIRQTYSGPSSLQKPVEKLSPQKVGGTTIIRSNLQQSATNQLQCKMCNFKTADRALFNEHQRNHSKVRPFKCRMCLERFETREAAQTHAKIHQTGYLKCGICNVTFVKREQLSEHLKTHEKIKSISQPEVIVMKQQTSNNIKGSVTMQKPLTDIIKEALSEDDQDAGNEEIEFHSCNICSLTFLNKKLFSQHMKSHESSAEELNDKPQVVFTKGKQQDTLGDLESIFEKMHSENAHQSVPSNGAMGDMKLITTTQESGGITYNITIPQDDIPQSSESDDKPQQVRISMPNLDDDEDKSGSEHHQSHQVAVSMPSLNADDEENTQSSQEQTVVQQMEGGEHEQVQAIPMDLEDLQQAAGEGQQLKFIVDENGQFLQLDNHILTTDAEGNQILVQGTDQEQLQHLLQSVSVDGQQVLVQLQGNGEGIVDGDGTLQMLGDGQQGQMILVQGADGESQLIDASMLQTEGGNLVLQQGADGETHLTTADGIPVSVSFGGEESGITFTMAGEHGDGQQYVIQQPMELGEGQEQMQIQHEGTEAQLQLEENSQDQEMDSSNEAAIATESTIAEPQKTPIAEASSSQNVTSTTESEHQIVATDSTEALTTLIQTTATDEKIESDETQKVEEKKSSEEQ